MNIKKFQLFGLVIASLLIPTPSLAGADTSIDALIDSIKGVCHYPAGDGKYWKVEASGNAGATIRLFGEIGGDASFSQEEWEGIQGVLPKDQVQDNDSYRTCVEKLTPVFLQKFQPENSDAPVNEAKACTREEWDKAEILSESAGQKIMEKFGGGQDLRVEMTACQYNAYSKALKTDMQVFWNGLVFKSNNYNIDGKLKTDLNGKTSDFSESYANDKAKSLRFWATLTAGAIALGELSKANAQ